MKLKFLLPVLAISAAVAFHLNVIAHDDNDGDNEDGDHENGDHHGDCDIDGTETLEAKVILVATSNAPAGASGLAKLEAENEDGVTAVTLEVKTTGLAAGDYTLSAVRISDGSSVPLGQITVGCRKHHDGDEDEDEDDNDDGDHDEDNERDSSGMDGGEHDGNCSTNNFCWGKGNCTTNDLGEVQCDETNALTGKVEIPLPADLDPMDIAQIIVSDADGVPLLIGDLVNPDPGTTVKFQARVLVAPEAAAPGAQGKAQVKSTAKKGKQKHQFTMIASGVPASSTFDVHVNGTSVGTAKSNKKGKVLVKKLPANLRTVRSVKLMDSQGHAAASVKF